MYCIFSTHQEWINDSRIKSKYVITFSKWILISVFSNYLSILMKNMVSEGSSLRKIRIRISSKRVAEVVTKCVAKSLKCFVWYTVPQTLAKDRQAFISLVNSKQQNWRQLWQNEISRHCPNQKFSGEGFK